MVQLLGRTYRIDVTLSIHVGCYQSDESGNITWRTTVFLIDKGEVYRAPETHATRTDAMRRVRRALYGEAQ